ncbi:MAG TPA: DNA repair protein RecO, partial [Verrucomicrobiae bacterium]|nr:DNA repair protein RecO [Verrucomicrobiae bacterium]
MQTSERAHGLVLRTRPLTETSLIVNWLTLEFGRISTVAKGARRTKSPFRGMLDLFYEAEFSFQRSRRSELHTLREVALQDTNTALRRELGYLQQAAYCSALVEQSTERETPLPVVFELMRAFLHALPLTPPQPQTVFAFELKLLEELGLQPNLDASRLTEGSRVIARMLGEKDWASTARLKLSEAQTAELRQF